MKVVRQTGIANNIPINIPTRIIASFSGLALYRSRQRRLRLNNDVRFSPLCSGGAAHARVFISSPINLFPYVGSKTLIWKRDEETWEPFLFVFSKFFDTFFEIEYQNRWFLEHDEFDNSVLVEGGWCKGLENCEAISNKYGSRSRVLYSKMVEWRQSWRGRYCGAWLNFFNFVFREWIAYYQCNLNTFSRVKVCRFFFFFFFSKQDQIYEASFRDDIKKRKKEGREKYSFVFNSIRKDIRKIFFDLIYERTLLPIWIGMKFQSHIFN